MKTCWFITDQRLKRQLLLDCLYETARAHFGDDCIVSVFTSVEEALGMCSHATPDGAVIDVNPMRAKALVQALRSKKDRNPDIVAFVEGTQTIVAESLETLGVEPCLTLDREQALTNERAYVTFFTAFMAPYVVESDAEQPVEAELVEAA